MRQRQRGTQAKENGQATNLTTGRDTGEPVRGGSLTYATEADASGGYCLPTAQLAAGGIIQAGAIYDGLFSLDDKLQAQPFLAKDYSWDPTYTAMTVHLRPGIKFHDGSDLTSSVVKLNFDVARAEPEASKKTGLTSLLFRFVYSDIASIDAPDPLTVVFHTKRPWPALPEFMAGGRNGIAAEAQLMAGPEGCKSKLIGTGPFELVKWTPLQEMQLKANPNYWRKDAKGRQLPYLDKLTFKDIEGGSSRVDALRGGTIQAFHSAGYKEPAAARELKGTKVLLEPKGNREVAYGMVNVRKAPTDDVELRKMLSAAIDRTQLLEIYSNGKFDQANQPFDTNVSAYVKDIPAVPYDPDAAQKYFKDKKVSIDLYYSTDPTVKAIAEEVKQELADVGVTVNVSEIDQSSLIDQALSGDYNVIMFRNHPGLDPDTEYNWWYSTSPANFGHIGNAETDRLLDEGRVELDPNKRKQIYQEFNRKLNAGAFAQWNWYNQWGVAMSDKVHNIAGDTLPDGRPDYGMRWGWHSLAAAWVEK
ncbi:MAG: ABC transporter substrate-binding protein [Microthrixaceae bacterium]